MAWDPKAWRTVLPALVVAVAVAVAGCSSKPAASPPATRAAGSQTAGDNGEASKDPKQIVADAQHELQQARSFQVSGSTMQGTTTIGVDLGLDRSGNAQGHLTINGATAELISAGGRFYLRGKPFWAQFGGARFAERAGDRWVRLPANVAGFSELTKPDAFTKDLTPDGPVILGGTATVNGHPAIILLDGKSGDKLYVATTGKPYPLRIEPRQGSAGTITFDRFDVPVNVTAPPDAVDITRLRG